MENNNDKSKTEKFNPEQARKKPEIERSAEDIYSEARQTPEYSFDKYEKADKGNRRLVILTVALAVMLVFVCVLAFYIIKSTPPKEENPTESPQIEIEAEEEEEEEEILKEESYSFVFYPESITKNEDYLSVRADLFDTDMQKKETSSVKINQDTDILVNGERISSNSFIYIIESLAGEQIVFDGVLRTEEKVVIKLSYNGEIGGEETAEPEEIPTEPSTEEVPEEEVEPIIIDGI